MEQAETFFHGLKQLRVAQGISLEDISSRTRINTRFLEALERGEFEILPKTYMRLILISYCRIIGANETDTLDQLEEHLGESKDYPLSVPKDSGTTTLRPPKKENLIDTEGIRGPARLRRDLLIGAGIFIILIVITFFARRVSQRPAVNDYYPSIPTTDRTEAPLAGTAETQMGEPSADVPEARSPDETIPTGTASQPAMRSQPVVPPESAVDLPNELFTQDRIVAHSMQRVDLTPPVRLTLMARDNVVIQLVTASQREPVFNLVVAEAHFWTIHENLEIRTNAIELLRGDLNGVPINIGQASGIGALRVTPSGEYEVFAYSDTLP